jgi:hypothetical protein
MMFVTEAKHDFFCVNVYFTPGLIQSYMVNKWKIYKGVTSQQKSKQLILVN